VTATWKLGDEPRSLESPSSPIAIEPWPSGTWGEAVWHPQMWIAIDTVYVWRNREPLGLRDAEATHAPSIVGLTINGVTYALKYDGRAAHMMPPSDYKRNARWFEYVGSWYIAVPPGCMIHAHVKGEQKTKGAEVRVAIGYRDVVERPDDAG